MAKKENLTGQTGAREKRLPAYAQRIEEDGKVKETAGKRGQSTKKRRGNEQ